MMGGKSPDRLKMSFRFVVVCCLCCAVDTGPHSVTNKLQQHVLDLRIHSTLVLY